MQFPDWRCKDALLIVANAQADPASLRTCQATASHTANDDTNVTSLGVLRALHDLVCHAFRYFYHGSY